MPHPTPPRKSPCPSSERLFHAVDELVIQLRREGRMAIADEVALAWDCAAGPTDGWAFFIDAIDNAESRRFDT